MPPIWFPVALMLVIMAIINHPPNHHFHGWYVHHQKWVVDDIAIPTLITLYPTLGTGLNQIVPITPAGAVRWIRWESDLLPSLNPLSSGRVNVWSS